MYYDVWIQVDTAPHTLDDLDALIDFKCDRWISHEIGSQITRTRFRDVSTWRVDSDIDEHNTLIDHLDALRARVPDSLLDRLASLERQTFRVALVIGLFEENEFFNELIFSSQHLAWIGRGGLLLDISTYHRSCTFRRAARCFYYTHIRPRRWTRCFDQKARIRL